jgi:hypothetical protein
MNRLIIVGNGFDLAHGLKTSYCDFISDYLCKVLDKYSRENTFDDELISLRFNPRAGHSTYFIEIPMKPVNACRTLAMIKEKNARDQVKFASKFVEKIMEKADKYKWVDIENEFFDQLNSCRLSNSNRFNEEKVEELNNQFAVIKKLLENYLNGNQLDKETFKRNELINDIFQQRISGRSNKGTGEQKKVFLNFNYTNTLKYYLGATPNQFSDTTEPRGDKIIHIHGELNNDENPIVFGFGDEHNKHYLEFEDLRIDEVFRHIKSFAYFKTPNYHNLMNFLADDFFEVFIVGHSCGLSDRTMFRQIFEHKNIDSVKIYYHIRDNGTDDYEDKTISLARHFTDKANMRMKIVPKPLCSHLPQYIIVP